MNNYEYIIAGLPELAAGWKPGETGPEDCIREIEELCSEKDCRTIGFLREGLVDSNLDKEFYRKALTHKDAFIRGYFLFDLNVRNAKVKYLNKALGRPADKDVLTFSEEEDKVLADITGADFEESARLESILNGNDILARERGMDDLVWEKIDSLTTFDYFDIDAVLGFIARLHIVTRWYELDEQAGRERFKRLVDEVRGTFRGVEYNG